MPWPLSIQTTRNKLDKEAGLFTEVKAIPIRDLMIVKIGTLTHRSVSIFWQTTLQAWETDLLLSRVPGVEARRSSTYPACTFSNFCVKVSSIIRLLISSRIMFHGCLVSPQTQIFAKFCQSANWGVDRKCRTHRLSTRQRRENTRLTT